MYIYIYIYTFPKFVMLWYDDVLMKGSCEKYVRGYNESELDVKMRTTFVNRVEEREIHMQTFVYYSIRKYVYHIRVLQSKLLEIYKMKRLKSNFTSGE